MTDVLTGTTTTSDKLTGFTTLKFREVPIDSTLKFTGSGTPDNPQVGDIGSYTADLFNSNNVLVGTKDINAVTVQQLKNGDIIQSLNEIYHLPGGEIFAQGTIDANQLHDTPQTTNIIGGSGIYSNIHGKETITDLGTNIPGEVSTRLHF